MFKINSYVMPIHTPSGAIVTTPDRMAMAQRVNRLKRELKNNLSKKGLGL
jgi:hypothetical protein